jgi:hypothetical protein
MLKFKTEQNKYFYTCICVAHNLKLCLKYFSYISRYINYKMNSKSPLLWGDFEELNEFNQSLAVLKRAM